MSAIPVRSIETLRIPVDRIPVTMTLYDGKELAATVFVPFGETILRFFDEGPRFVPVLRDGKVCFIARRDLACLTVPISPLHMDDGDLPVVFQSVEVELRCGLRLAGRLRWVAPIGYQRTMDHLNAEPNYLELRTPERTHYVAKSQIVAVEEA